MGNILTVNSGSSSIKFSVYAPGNSRLLSGRLERIGLPEGAFLAFDGKGAALAEKKLRLPDHVPALRTLFDWLKERPEGKAVEAVGHRVVHGGKITSPRIIDPELMEALRALVPFAAEHLPHEIKAIEAVGEFLPGLTQAACFDTSFHASMPLASRTLSIPRELRAEGIERYGFHGLSYEYIMEELARIDPVRASGRVVIAHLGNGASMCAVKGGRCLDTTMGFTPLGGLVMSTRTGDIDPGVIVYILKKKGLGPDELNELLNRKSGLLGISGISPDMADLLEREGASDDAGLAVEVFCRQAKKFLGSFIAALGGIDTLVFTAGIGENSPVIRERILEGLGFIGLDMDPEENGKNSPVVSRGPVRVRVMKTNEELMIARHTARIIGLG